MTAPAITKKQTKSNKKIDLVASYFILSARESGGEMTNLKLQKLLYYAQAWCLAINGKPLFNEKFQAWMHGPVQPEIYQKYKRYGWRSIDEEIEESLEDIKKEFSEEELNILEQVREIYMPIDAYGLEKLTHQEEPWQKARGVCEPGDRCMEEIDENLMKSYYGQLLVNDEK